MESGNPSLAADDYIWLRTPGGAFYYVEKEIIMLSPLLLSEYLEKNRGFTKASAIVLPKEVGESTIGHIRASCVTLKAAAWAVHELIENGMPEDPGASVGQSSSVEYGHRYCRAIDALVAYVRQDSHRDSRAIDAFASVHQDMHRDSRPIDALVAYVQGSEEDEQVMSEIKSKKKNKKNKKKNKKKNNKQQIIDSSNLAEDTQSSTRNMHSIHDPPNVTGDLRENLQANAMGETELATIEGVGWDSADGAEPNEKETSGGISTKESEEAKDLNSSSESPENRTRSTHSIDNSLQPPEEFRASQETFIVGKFEFPTKEGVGYDSDGKETRMTKSKWSKNMNRKKQQAIESSNLVEDNLKRNRSTYFTDEEGTQHSIQSTQNFTHDTQKETDDLRDSEVGNAMGEMGGATIDSGGCDFADGAEPNEKVTSEGLSKKESDEAKDKRNSSAESPENRTRSARSTDNTQQPTEDLRYSQEAIVVGEIEVQTMEGMAYDSDGKETRRAKSKRRRNKNRKKEQAKDSNPSDPQNINFSLKISIQCKNQSLAESPANEASTTHSTTSSQATYDIAGTLLALIGKTGVGSENTRYISSELEDDDDDNDDNKDLHPDMFDMGTQTSL